MDREELKRRLSRAFARESEEILSILREHFPKLTSTVSLETHKKIISILFRAIHSLKGAARTVERASIESFCHSLEDFLSQWQDRPFPQPLTQEGVEKLLDCLEDLLQGESLSLDLGVEALEKILFQASPPKVRPSRRRSTQTRTRKPTRSIQLALEDVHQFYSHLEDLLPHRYALSSLERQALQLYREMQDMEEEEPLLLEEKVHRWRHQVYQLYRKVGNVRLSFQRLFDRLLSEGQELLLVSCAQFFAPLGYTVRTLAQELGKQVRWRMNLPSISLDKRVLEVVNDALRHLIRNALDHGIEPPEERVRKGKSPWAVLSLSLDVEEEGEVSFCLSDDGRGINVDVVRQKLIDKQILSEEEAVRLSTEELLSHLFQVGISTSEKVDIISGRGVGLASVMEAVEQLEGRVRVQSRPEEGTTFTITVPRRLSTFHGLLVQFESHKWLVPFKYLVSVRSVLSVEVSRKNGQSWLYWSDQEIPFFPVNGEESFQGNLLVLILQYFDSILALEVSELLGEWEGIPRSLEPPLGRLPYVQAVGVGEQGEVYPILRVADLVSPPLGVSPFPKCLPQEEALTPSVPPTVLLVEDSLTTRVLFRTILQSGGFEVLEARDGNDAWKILQLHTVDVVVCDLELPELHGWELLRQIRGDEKLSHLPVICLTLYSGEEKRAKSLEFGADAYLEKWEEPYNRIVSLVQEVLAKKVRQKDRL